MQNIKLNDISTAESCQQKHVAIDSSLIRLENCLDNLMSLVSDIRGVHTEEGIKPSPPRSIPCLAEILNQTPERVHASCDKLNNLINDLRAELF